MPVVDDLESRAAGCEVGDEMHNMKLI
jgi:hypothetical protein